MLHKPKDLYLSSFKVMNRFLVNEIIKYRGPYPYTDGLIYSRDPKHRADSGGTSRQCERTVALHHCAGWCGCGSTCFLIFQ